MSERHLDDERILASLVDENDLTPGERSHLGACAECSSRLRTLNATLSGLTEMASRSTPFSAGTVSLPENAGARPMAKLMSWSMGLAFAMAAIVVAGVYLLGRIHGPGVFDASGLADEARRDALLIAEVRSLEDNPLPEPYRHMVPDPGVRLDDAFFDFLVPPQGGGKDRSRT